MGIPTKPKIKYIGLFRLGTATTVAFYVAAFLYLLAGIILHKYIWNVPQFLWRFLMLSAFAVSGSSFARHAARYTELGGDYALACRSLSIVLVTVISTAFIEAYYLIPQFTSAPVLRVPLLLGFALFGCIPAIPIAMFMALNLRVSVMIVTNAIYGLFFIATTVLRTVMMIEGKSYITADGVLRAIANVASYYSPVYFLMIVLSAVMISVAVVNYKKEVSYFEKIYPEELESLDAIEDSIDSLENVEHMN